MGRTPVISLGAGVQSSALLLMAAAGEFDATPGLAIFADTGDEPREVYEWLDYLRERVEGRVEIVTVTAGHLGGDILEHARGERKRISNPPFRVMGEDGRPSLLGRSCTRDYKIRPILRHLRERGYGPKRPVDQWLGISLDEIARAKREKPGFWAQREYPLLDRRMTRHDCVLWMERNGHPRPPRSACFYCPFHGDAEWRRMRDDDPESWNAAVEFDLAIRQLPSVKQDAYLHRSLVPLGEVDFTTAEDRGQGSLFDDECEGMCGV